MKENSIRKIDLSVANWMDVKDANYDVVILPWGAIEPHNYHLPYITDCYLSQNVALESSVEAYERSGVLCGVMPPIFLGSQNPGQWSNPFCIHTSSETQKSILNDIILSLRGQGLRKLVIVNGHGGNSFKLFVRDFAFKYPDFVIVLVDWWTVIPSGSYFEAKPDEHAGELETSVLMYYRPDLVCLEIAGDGFAKKTRLESVNNKTGWLPRHWGEVTEDTGIGNPHKATAEKGERFAKDVVSKIADLIIELKDYEVNKS